jgi:hypothetical protein
MSNLLYHWNFTNDTTISDALNNIIYDSEANLSAKVISRDSITSTVSRNENGINLNNVESGVGIYIDLLGLDTVNLGGNMTIEMVVANTDTTKDSIYFQTIREYIDSDSNGLDDNLGIAESGFNNHSASVTLRYDQGDSTKIKVRTDSKFDSTAKDNTKINYTSFRNADTGSTLNNSSFHHYTFAIEHNASDSKSLQIYVDGTEQGSSTQDLEKVVSDAVRQFNAIGTQKNPSSAPYLSGTVKYLKIYQNAMTSSEVTSTYNNYNAAPYYSDIVSGTNAEKYTRRHSTLNTYFTDNPSITSFSMTGNQLGLLSPAKSYNVHKFTNGGDVDISSGYHYIPLSGQNQFIIFKNGTSWYKITQTSVDDGASAIYKYEKSTDSGDNYEAPVTGNTFGQSITDGSITIGFGGAESGQSGSGSGNGKLTVKSNGKIVVKLNGKITIK